MTAIVHAVGTQSLVATIQMRPPSPPNTLADGLGSVAAVLFIVPVVEAYKKARGQRKDKAG